MPFITQKTITETFLERVKSTPAAVGFQFKPTHAEVGPIGQWKQVTFKEFYSDCRRVSFGLMGLGVKPGDRVVILSNTRYDWSLSDMAILGAKGITVPIYASNTPEDVIYIARHCEAKILIVEDEKQLQKILEMRMEKPGCLPGLEKVIVMEPSAMAVCEKFPSEIKYVLTLQALKELGRREEAKEPTRFDKNLGEAKPDDLITICYTSGTTGVPKGVMLSHDNLMSVLEDCVASIGTGMTPEAEVVLAFLPASHIFGKVESLAVYTFGWRHVFAESLEQLMPNMAEVRPTFVFSVPRVFEKAYNRILSSLDMAPPTKKKLFAWARGAGQAYFNAIWDHRTPSIAETLEFKLAKALVLDKVAQRFGGRLKFAICGGAPLPKEIGQFFRIMGISILEGYGLTETCAPVCVNLPEDVRFGVVGRPLPEVTLKIADDGEILVKSRKVFKGYYKMKAETEEVLKQGWFYTGDIGHLDAEGFLHITDRKKDLIVTSGGKNIAPQKIENLAKSNKLISQFVAHGDRRHYLTALVTLDRDQIIRFANEEQVLFSGYSELIKHPKILSLVQRVIDEINQKLASYETIKKFVILPDDFTIEAGELTPSMKVRRSFINKKFKAELDSMYQESSSQPLDSL